MSHNRNKDLRKKKSAQNLKAREREASALNDDDKGKEEASPRVKIEASKASSDQIELKFNTQLEQIQIAEQILTKLVSLEQDKYIDNLTGIIVIPSILSELEASHEAIYRILQKPQLPAVKQRGDEIAEHANSVIRDLTTITTNILKATIEQVSAGLNSSINDDMARETTVHLTKFTPYLSVASSNTASESSSKLEALSALKDLTKQYIASQQNNTDVGFLKAKFEIERNLSSTASKKGMNLLLI